MKNKTLLWVGIASALLIGGGVFWWMKNKPKTDDTKDDTKIDDTKKEESKPADTAPKNTSASYPATPFKDKAQGNAFRAWMMKNHNDWRLNGDILDSSGDYDGTTIRKAYQDYGAEYAKATAPVSSPVSSKSGFSKGDKLYIKKSVANVYSYPNLKNRIGYIQQSATSQATFKGDANTKGWVTAVAKYISVREGKKEVVGNVYIQTNDVTNLAP